LLSLNGYLIIGVLSLTASMLVVPAGTRSDSILWWPVHLLSLVACGLWLGLFRRFIFKNRSIKPIALWAIALFGISLGAIKGTVTAILSVHFGLEQVLQEAVAARIIQTSFLGLFAVFGLALIEATLDKYQVERDLLVTERVHQQISNSDGRESGDSVELREFIAAAKARLEGIMANSNSLAEQKVITAGLIRDIVETGLRPLSHRLWQTENAKLLNFSFVDLAKIAVVGQPVAVLPAVSIYFIGALATLAAHIDPGLALVRAAVGALIMASVFLVARLVQPKSRLLAWSRFLLSNAVATYLLVTLTDIWFGAIQGVSPVGTGIAVGIWMTEVSFISGFVVAAFQNHVKVRSQLEALLMQPDVELMTRKARSQLMNRDLANYLHGSVQNRLLSAALRIETGQGGPEDLLGELRAVEDLLDTAVAPIQDVSDLDLPQRLSDLAARWAGYLSIEISLDADGYGSELDKQIYEVANEAISNAVRHGLASSLQFEVTSTVDGWLTILATDDGLGPRSGSAGLGSALFDSIARENWSLKANQLGGSALRLRLGSNRL
jgi:signal transduction histidine kinase